MALLSLNSRLRKNFSRAIFRKHKNYSRLSTLGILFVILFFIITLYNPPLRGALDNAFLTVTTSMIKGFKEISETFFSIEEHFRSENSLKKEKNDLKNRLVTLSLENQQIQHKLLTYESLKELLLVKYTNKKPIATIPVLAALPSSKGRHIILDGGKNSGININSYVVDKHGLVGKVIALNDSYAKVQLVVDASARIPIITKSTQHHAIFSGHNNNPPTLEFIHAKKARQSNLKEGDIALTSGEGGVFSPNLPVGTITSCQKNWCVKPFSANYPTHVMVFTPLLNKSVEALF